MIYHKPVLLKESMELLNIKRGGLYADATLGGGGHTDSILAEPKVEHVYGFDQDSEALAFSEERLRKYEDRVTLIKANFEEMRSKLALLKVKNLDGVIFDLGVSSRQIDSAERGFSFEENAELDMRMDRQTELKAKDVINQKSKEELAKIFRELGEEKAAYRIAQAIETARNKKPIETTKELSDIIEKQMRANPLLVTKTKARIFQALRIYVNRELEVLDNALEDAINLLNSGGRLVVISYHSLEDRIVKNRINYSAKGCLCPPVILKCVCGHHPKVKILTPKHIQPTEEEIQGNKRSRSAKLRAVEKI